VSRSPSPFFRALINLEPLTNKHKKQRSEALYFHITLEPHFKHSGDRTGRRINPESSNWDCLQSKTSMVVQGACADGIKLALSEIHKQLPRSTRIIAIVHDEIIVEASPRQERSISIEPNPVA
jgi:hypothetical protein